MATLGAHQQERLANETEFRSQQNVRAVVGVWKKADEEGRLATSLEITQRPDGQLVCYKATRTMASVHEHVGLVSPHRTDGLTNVLASTLGPDSCEARGGPGGQLQYDRVHDRLLWTASGPPREGPGEWYERVEWTSASQGYRRAASAASSEWTEWPSAPHGHGPAVPAAGQAQDSETGAPRGDGCSSPTGAPAAAAAAPPPQNGEQGVAIGGAGTPKHVAAAVTAQPSQDVGSSPTGAPAAAAAAPPPQDGEPGTASCSARTPPPAPAAVSARPSQDGGSSPTGSPAAAAAPPPQDGEPGAASGSAGTPTSAPAVVATRPSQDGGCSSGAETARAPQHGATAADGGDSAPAAAGEEAPAARSADEDESRREPQAYLVVLEEFSRKSNQSYTALSYRRSKKIEDRDGGVASAKCNSVVDGVEEVGGWIRVGDRFLPLKIQGVPVLRLLEPQEAMRLRLEAPAGAAGAAIEAPGGEGSGDEAGHGFILADAPAASTGQPGSQSQH